MPGGSSFFEEPNKIERKSPPLRHDPQQAALEQGRHESKRDRPVTSIIPNWRTLEKFNSYSWVAPSLPNKSDTKVYYAINYQLMTSQRWWMARQIWGGHHVLLSSFNPYCRFFLSWMMMHHGCFQVSFSTALAPRVFQV
jgi:hypothetical protein